MAYEFKKLSDVNVVESMSDNAHVLVEENGEIVKIPKNVTNKGLVKTINSIEPDENGNLEIRQSTTVVFQDIMGRLTTSHSASEIMDLILNNRDAQGLRFKFGVRDFSKPMGPDPEYCHTRIDMESYYNGTSYLMLKFHIYFGDAVAPVIVDCIEGTITIDPDWVAPAEPIPAPATASVGQTIVVKAVDENGKPTEWEVSDKLSELSEEIESIKEGGGNLVEKMLFEEPEMVFSPLDDTGLYMGGRADPGFQFAEGKTYIVTVDGVAREYVASTLDGMDTVAIGNASFMNVEGGSFEDTGDPILATTPSTEQLFILTNEPGEVHSVKVSMMVEKSSGGVMWVNVTSNGNDEYTADKTYAEIAEAIVNGVIPYCLFGVLCVPLVRSTTIKYGNTYAIAYEHDFAVIDYTCEMTHIRIREDDSVMVESFFINEPAS